MEGVAMQCEAEGSGMEGVTMLCVRPRGQGWRVWPCSVGGVRGGGCGHAVWEGSEVEGVTMQCGRGQGQGGGCGHAVWEGRRQGRTNLYVYFSSIQPRL